MKIDKLIKYALWSLLLATAAIIITVLYMAYLNNKVMASYPQGTIYNEGFGMIIFVLFYYLIYTLFFIAYLALLYSYRSLVSSLWKKVQLAIIIILSILPTFFIAIGLIFFTVKSETPTYRETVPINSTINDSVTPLDTNLHPWSSGF